MSKFLTYFSLFAILIYSCKNRNEKVRTESKTVSNIGFISNKLYDKSNNLITLIRDGKLDKSSSIELLKNLLNEIAKQYKQNSVSKFTPIQWVFPIKGYTTETSIGDSKDDGYIPDRYDFFDGNDHKGHPALDIFIKDANQDCIDDKTKKPVDILSMTGGVVLATENNWDTASLLKGGKYIWIYDPLNKFLIYYAHNNTINIKPGQIVQPGNKIATCGRTGFNAFKKRSPTHLHIMLLKLDENNYPKPINPYNYLRDSKPISKI